jgi:hypothetical protein
VSTVATGTLKAFALDWEKKCGLKSAVLSGIVGDASHKGGYHRSREDQPSKANYSVVRPDDRLGPDDAASAVDMSMNTADMKTCTARLAKAYDNVADPRRKYMNAFNGTTNGTTARRWDVYARRTEPASSDHLWHVHLSIRRRYVNSATATKALISILKGETVAQYLASIGVAPPAATTAKAPAYPGRELRRNDTQAKPDAAVKLFQARMVTRGWTSLGKADGFFGPKLESVVKRWQASIHLPVDGKVGPKTWPTPWTKPLAK